MILQRRIGRSSSLQTDGHTTRHSTAGPSHSLPFFAAGFHWLIHETSRLGCRLSLCWLSPAA